MYILVFAGVIFHGVLAFVDSLKVFSDRPKLQKLFWTGTFLFDVGWYFLLSSWLQMPSSLTFILGLYLLICATTRGSGSTQDNASVIFILAGLIGVQILSLRPVDEGLTLAQVSVLSFQSFSFVATGFFLSWIRIQFQELGWELFYTKEASQAVLHSLPLALVSFDPSGSILFYNPPSEDLFGPSPGEGGSVKAWISNPELFSRIFSGSDGSSFTVDWERPSPKDLKADLSLIRTRVISQRDAQGKVSSWTLISEDLTQQQKWEAKLRESEKLAAVGRLSAGIAHEIRNPLAGISGALQMLRNEVFSEDDERLRQIALKEIDRLNHLITEFLDFAKPMSLQSEPIGLVEFLQEQKEWMMKDPRFKGLKIEWKGLEGLSSGAELLGNKDQLRQVFLNLVINSAQALEGKQVGKFKDRTLGVPSGSLLGSLEQASGQTLEQKSELTSDPTRQADISIEAINGPSFLGFRVSDCGEGMSEDIQKKIFEPFFSTKSKGTGLGLALSRKYLEAMGAHVEVQSKAGFGTVFELRFRIKL